MPIADELKQEADHIARLLHGCVPEIEQKIAEIDERKAELVAERDAMNRAPERALNFQPASGPDYICPRCWVQDETRATLRPALAPEQGRARLRCDACGFEHESPA